MKSWYTPKIQKNELWGLIKIIGNYWNEPKNSLSAYASQVYEANKHDLNIAIACFRDLVKQVEWNKKYAKKI